MTDTEVLALAEFIKARMHGPEPQTLQERIARRRAVEEAREAKDRLAQEFGARRGWLLARHDFSYRALLGRKVHSGSAYITNELHDNPYCLDHLVFYRWPDKRAAGLVSQPYGLNKEKVAAWATRLGLLAEFPDFPSWHNPGGCGLFVLTPAAPARATGPLF